MARAVWAIIAHCLGASNVPSTFHQCWNWCEKWLSFGQNFHAIGIAAIYWAIWKTRNSVCFQGKIVTSPITIICYACSLMGYWAGLFGDDEKEKLVAGVDMMLQIALRLVAKTTDSRKQGLLEDTKEDDQDQ
jgi:hypothetical protein